LNLPADMRPERVHLRPFANYFSTYVTSSFDIIEQPGTRLSSRCGCYCRWCAHIVNAPHLQPKKLTQRDKKRAVDLMADRLISLGREEGLALPADTATAIVQGSAARRSAAYSAYGHWLIRRLQGQSDGKAILALWREIAWRPTGSPIKDFQLRYADFVDAEALLVGEMRTALKLG
jgi:hypothetical protein